ncbi:MAG: 16S rRNA (adenine(1518)-N(6)/adenine(1519)-N(6))-dimethyltransferase RsmA [Clostridia bacterium]|nr:16S rRNA (adenine(1518)-N(6)/adenine(1519)-N(6))-dimethyltransferase RsmA [Clostridia bacterium]
MDLSNINTIKKILKKYDFKLSHTLGQNFIIDPEVCPQIVQQSGADKETGVIEIGPGIGVLTKELAKIEKIVVAIELDSKLIPGLKETLVDFANIQILNEDILKADLEKLINTHFSGFKKITICANLPYYITTPVIMKCLEKNLDIKAITFMIQKEVAERICAEVGSRKSGSITVAVNYYSQPEFLFEVKKESFFPSPKVDSAVIKLTPHDKYKKQVKNKKLFFRVVNAAFAQRRKNILNSLSAGLCVGKDPLKKILLDLNLDKNLRAENLTMEQFISLTDILDISFF